MPALQADLFGAGLCEPEEVPACLFVVFGATGDLMARKIAPALYNLARDRDLADRLAVLGVARRPRSDEQFRQEMLQALRQYSRGGLDESFWQRFSQRWHYQTARAQKHEHYEALRQRLTSLDRLHGCQCNRVFYLSVSADLVEDIVLNLGEVGLNRPSSCGSQ